MRQLISNFLLIPILFIGISQAQTKKVLFIGNSYTNNNNLPNLVSQVAASMNDTLIYDAHTPGGARLLHHASNVTALNKIRSNNWNHVVLQAQSQEPSFPIGQVQNEVFPYAQALCDSIRANDPCTRPVFYMTWGRKNGDANNCAFFPPLCTYEGMDSLLNLRYRQMGNDNDAYVSPVGAVWHYIRDNYPNIELYAGDGSHPSQAGSYAAACTFYSIIWQKDPSNIPFNYTLPDSTAGKIKTAVKAIAFDNLSEWNVGKYDPMANFVITQTDSLIDLINLSGLATSYAWDFGDGNTSTDFNPSHIYLQGGTYDITLIAEKCGVKDTFSSSVTYTPPDTTMNTSISGLEKRLSFEIYPNPSSGQLLIKDIDYQRIKQVFAINNQGQTVEVKHEKGRVDFSRFSPGVYFMKVVLMNGEKRIKRFVKL